MDGQVDDPRFPRIAGWYYRPDDPGAPQVGDVVRTSVHGELMGVLVTHEPDGFVAYTGAKWEKVYPIAVRWPTEAELATWALQGSPG